MNLHRGGVAHVAARRASALRRGGTTAPRVRRRPTWTYNFDARGGTSWHNIPIERPAGTHDATAIMACAVREMPAVLCTRSGLAVSAAAGSVQAGKPVCGEA